ncbi:MAG: hypothetical protein KDC52_04800 [Ignavibacteriae bacterium]|nr:hypothetical protein [Ignavibacteriota bacterium]
MNFILKALFSISTYGIIGYLLTLSFLLFNKYISYSLTHQYSNYESMSFTATLIYIFNNTLTHQDFLFCLYGLVFMLFVGVLRNFQRRTSIY